MRLVLTVVTFVTVAVWGCYVVSFTREPSLCCLQPGFLYLSSSNYSWTSLIIFWWEYAHIIHSYYYICILSLQWSVYTAKGVPTLSLERFIICSNPSIIIRGVKSNNSLQPVPISLHTLFCAELFLDDIGAHWENRAYPT